MLTRCYTIARSGLGGGLAVGKRPEHISTSRTLLLARRLRQSVLVVRNFDDCLAHAISRNELITTTIVLYAAERLRRFPPGSL